MLLLSTDQNSAGLKRKSRDSGFRSGRRPRVKPFQPYFIKSKHVAPCEGQTLCADFILEDL